MYLMYMLGKIIAMSHLIIAFGYSFYGLITAKNFYMDFLYFVFLITIQLSWVIFNHECIMSLVYKKIFYKNYKAGDTTDLDDFNEFSGKPNTQINLNRDVKSNSLDIQSIVSNVFNIAFFLSVIIVNNRSKISSAFSGIFIFIFIRYFYIYLNNATGENSRNTIERYFGKNVYLALRKIYEDYRVESIRESLNMLIVLIVIFYLLCIIYTNRKRL